jgi:V/A-type H+/Na+-transporting ATPase subunit I
MIVDLEKYLIFGSAATMDEFFTLAQRAGFLEFIGKKRKGIELPQEAKTFFSAIKIAKHYSIHPQEAPNTDLEPLQIAEKIVSLRQEEEALLEEERIIEAEIARISTFGDFSQEDLAAIEKDTKLIFQFFVMKSDVAKEFVPPPEMIHVGTDYDLDYFIAIQKEKKQYPKMIEILIDKPVGVLRKRLFQLREEVGKIEGDIKSFSNYFPQLQEGLAEHLNHYHLDQAKHNASLKFNNGLFSIEAWVPKTRVKSLFGLISHLDVECVPIAVESKDQIPTYMENKGAGRIGEDLLNIFDTPSHTDKDPSLWILVFFSLFFAMIISDAGYGMIFLLIVLFLRWKFPNLHGVKKRVLRLGLILSCSVISWGIFTGSYFGITFSPQSPTQKTSILAYFSEKKINYHLQQKDEVYQALVKKYPQVVTMNGKEVLQINHKAGYPIFEQFSENILLEFAFIIGVIHISLSFLRYIRRNWSGIGWILFLIGGYLYFPSIIHATTIVNFMNWIPKPVAYAWGLWILISGLVIAAILSFIQKRWGAITELLHVVQVFADILSYLRLYALALGAMVMARTFNDTLGVEVGIVLTLILILFGHTVNIGLGLMGGVVHGLRLNFLEWFHYSFEGGGRLFNPLKLYKK